jgi:hypothetical protein
MDIAQGETITITHNLGITATELTVGLWFSGTARGIHDYGCGGLTVDARPPERCGASWHSLTDTTLQVVRFPQDSDVEQVRAVIGHADPPHHESLVAQGGWQNIVAGTTFTFPHGLRWNPNLLLVRAECKSLPVQGVGGIHQLFAGGNYDPLYGWRGTDLRDLRGSNVAVARRSDDALCPRVHVRIQRRTVRVCLPLVLWVRLVEMRSVR